MPKKMMNLTEKDMLHYCDKYKVSVERYLSENQALKLKLDREGHQAYSEEQVNLLIFRRSSKNIVAAVLTFHEDLINEGLSAQSIYSMASHDGGANNLKAFMEQTKALHARGLGWDAFGVTVDDIILLCSHDGASKNLDAFINQTETLHAQGLDWDVLGITTHDAIRLCSKHGGSKNLDAFITRAQTLHAQGLGWDALGITAQDAIRLCSHAGGSKNLDAFITRTQTLHAQGLGWDALGITAQDAIRLCSNHGGWKNLDAFITRTQTLHAQNLRWDVLGITAQDVIRICSNHGGWKNLDEFIIQTQTLHAQNLRWDVLGITAQDVIRICSHDGGAKNLSTFVIYTQNLLSHGLNWEVCHMSMEDVVRILSRPGGSMRLQKFFEHADLLFKLGFSKQEIKKLFMTSAEGFFILMHVSQQVVGLYTRQEIVQLMGKKSFKKAIQDLLKDDSSQINHAVTNKQKMILNGIFSKSNVSTKEDMSESDNSDWVLSDADWSAFLTIINEETRSELSLEEYKIPSEITDHPQIEPNLNVLVDTVTEQMSAGVDPKSLPHFSGYQPKFFGDSRKRLFSDMAQGASIFEAQENSIQHNPPCSG